jgi:hypothetical protein
MQAHSSNFFVTAKVSSRAAIIVSKIRARMMEEKVILFSFFLHFIHWVKFQSITGQPLEKGEKERSALLVFVAANHNNNK